MHEGPADQKFCPGQLQLETFEVPELKPEEVLIEPIFGAWEGNYSHAVQRSPIDICRSRGEKSVVLGNCGVVRVLEKNQMAPHLKEGQICILMGNAVPDDFGYMMKAHAYDAENTVGIMAKKSKVHFRQLIPLPEKNPFSLEQWAAFSLRYITAWSNWRVAYGAYRLQVSQEMDQGSYQVWGWGGGVSLAQLDLAKRFGATTCLIASKDKRLDLAKKLGLGAIDRRAFPNLNYDEKNRQALEIYSQDEKKFLEIVREKTDGKKVQIFIDNIGEPVFRATLKALSREGVITTAGWKCGMNLTYLRASSSIARHTFVHTHYASYKEAEESVSYALKENWIPPRESLDEIYNWDEISQLANDYGVAKTDSYYPLFRINSV